MKNVEPYLIFNGNCEEAFTFYESVFNVKMKFISRYKDLPDNERTDISPSDMNKIVHALLPVSKEVYIMGADSQGTSKTTIGENVWLTLNIESETEAKYLFEKLSEGGKITMPLQKTFWAELYAMLTDKFGIHWMINYVPEQK